MSKHNQHQCDVRFGLARHKNNKLLVKKPTSCFCVRAFCRFQQHSLWHHRHNRWISSVNMRSTLIRFVFRFSIACLCIPILCYMCPAVLVLKLTPFEFLLLSYLSRKKASNRASHPESNTYIHRTFVTLWGTEKRRCHSGSTTRVHSVKNPIF